MPTFSGGDVELYEVEGVAGRIEPQKAVPVRSSSPHSRDLAATARTRGNQLSLR